jgi:HD-like signal output (HDOD) protein
VYAELTRRLADPSVSVVELGELVSEDTALAAQVLRMANSAYFGRDRSVSRLADAAARLGTRLLRNLVLTAELYGGFPMPRHFVPRLEQLQHHASLVARIASGLEPRAPWKDDAFASGLLHDVGKLVFLSRITQRFEAAEAEADRTGREPHLVEVERLGADHASVGAFLLGLWGLPSAIVDAVHRHHAEGGEIPQRLDAARAVALADRLAHDVTDPPEVRERRGALPVVVITDPRWSWWREMAEQMALEGSPA